MAEKKPADVTTASPTQAEQRAAAEADLPKAAEQDGGQPQAPGAEQVQEATNEAEAKGHWGEKTDKTDPNAYTVAGVTSGMPTPEAPAQD